MKNVKMLLVMLVMVAAVLSACSSKEENSSNGTADVTTKKYIIATDATYAPFEFEQDGVYVGIDIELLAAIAEEEGFEYELKPMDFKAIIPALTSNQIDAAMSGLTITEERKQALDISEGYFESGTAAIVHKDNTDIQSEEDFSDKVFAVKKGTVGAIYAETNTEKYNATIKYFDDTPSSMQEVANKNADITFEDYPVISYMLKVNPDTKLRIAVDKLAVEYYGFAVNKGKNAELLAAFNSGLEKVKASGKYDEIIAKYLGE